MVLAWGVHLFTGVGAVLGVAALLAISAGDFSRAGLLMLAALFIDAVDGSMARRVGVAEVLPGIDGRRLDDMVDYFNYVLVPAVFMVEAGNLVHWGFVAIPVLASAYGFSMADAKTEDDFFLGFPSYWNVVAMYLWLLDISPAIGTAITLGFAVLVFVPIKYIYPSKLTVLFRTTALLSALWMLAMAACLIDPERANDGWWVQISLAYPVYYFALSFWLGGWHRRNGA
jgi:phosphatidylcholine synthase